MRSYKEMARIGQVNLKLWRDYSQGLNLEELDTAVHLFIGSVCGEITPEEMEGHIALVEGVLVKRRGLYGISREVRKPRRRSQVQGGRNDRG